MKELQYGDEFEIKVDKLGSRGDGICHINKKVIIIKGAKVEVGKLYDIKINKILEKYAFAELIDGF